MLPLPRPCRPTAWHPAARLAGHLTASLEGHGSGVPWPPSRPVLVLGLVTGAVRTGGLRIVHLANVSLQATPAGLPGGGTLQSLTNGIGGWALILSLVGLVVGAALWALGAHSQNYQQSFVGRRAVLVSAVAALLIGAAPAVINFFFNAGLNLH